MAATPPSIPINIPNGCAFNCRVTQKSEKWGDRDASLSVLVSLFWGVSEWVFPESLANSMFIYGHGNFPYNLALFLHKFSGN